MPTTEKHGGLWFDDVESGYQLVFDEYHEDSDLIGAVHFKPSKSYRASVFEKVYDPQWSLPFRAARRPDAFFDNCEEAVAHVRQELKYGNGA